MKIYICILSITLCGLQVSDGKPPKGHHHGHGPLESNDIYATVNKPSKNGQGHGHSHHHPCGPPDDPNDIIYAELQHRPPGGPIYENVGGRHHHHSPSDNDPDVLYSPVSGPGNGHHHHGGRHHGGGHHGGNHLNDPDDDDGIYGYLPYQCPGTRPHGPPPLPPRPPGGHPDPHRNHPGHDHGNAIQRRGAFRK